MTTILDTPLASPAVRTSAGTIRPFAASDAADVADLLVRAFQKTDSRAPATMVAYLRDVYLEAPWFDPAIASRVMARPDGRITGFVGVSAMPLLVDGRPIRAGVISSLAVDDDAADAMTGPRLLRDVRAGVQDATLSDRSNAAAVSLLRSLRGEVFRNYSFDWVRSLRPAGFAIETLASRFGAVRVLSPLAAAFDRAALTSAGRTEQARWTTPSHVRGIEQFSERAVDGDELLSLVQHFLADFPARPAWSDADLAFILAHGAQKRAYGAFTAQAVLSPGGSPVGLFLYHLRPGRIAQVLQVFAAKRREAVVIDRLIGHALAAGAVAIRGRAHPQFTETLMERRCVFLPELTTTVVARDPDVLRHFQNGTMFFTGLAGENWMRLNGDAF